MSATALDRPNSLASARPFRVGCAKCGQTGLFMTVEGAIACGWTIEPQLIGEIGGVKKLEGRCGACRSRIGRSIDR